MLFSIIVPIYKVEAYLRKCIDSVLSQSFSDYELILVNDGSPDNCGEICDKYSVIDNRIIVVHKENGGLSDARNSGLSVAKGKYIICLDGDDYLVCSALSHIADVVSNREIDVVKCAHINLYPDGEEKLQPLPYRPLSEIVGRTHLYHELSRTSSSSWSASKNVYRRDIIVENNLKFRNGLIGAEDCDFFMKFIKYSNKYLFLNTPLIYYRRDRKGSITTNMSKEAIIGQLQVFYENYYLYANDKKAKNKGMRSYFANKFTNTISLLYHIKDNEEIVELTKYIKEHREVLKDVKGLRYIIAKQIWFIFGYYKGSLVIKKLRSIFQK